MNFWRNSVLVSLLCSFQTLAADVWHTAKIKYVSPLSFGAFVQNFYQEARERLNKNSPKYHYITVSQNTVSADGINTLLPVALVAATQQKPVSIVFDGHSVGTTAIDTLSSFRRYF